MTAAEVTTESGPGRFNDQLSLPYPERKRRYELWQEDYDSWCRRRDDWAELHGWPGGLAAKSAEEMALIADEPFDSEWELEHGGL